MADNKNTLKTDSKNVLIVVDMQNDFITGSLANPDADKIVPLVAEEIRKKEYDMVYFTLDSHIKDIYKDTNEGKHLPIPHCCLNTPGFDLDKRIDAATNSRTGDNEAFIRKSTFGFTGWGAFIPATVERITLVGTCTDICVISNALILKAVYPEVEIVVLKDLCAGSTREKHEAALEVMKSCQIEVR